MHLPRRYGGTDPCELGEAPEEREFRDYIEKVNAGLIGRPAGMGQGQEAGAGRSDGDGEEAGGVNLAAVAVQPPPPSQQDEAQAPLPPLPALQEEEGPGGQRSLAGRLVGFGKGVGQRAAGVAVGALRRLQPAFLTPLTPAQEANLGRENRFVYDEARGQWVLIEEEPEAPGQEGEEEELAESEERLVKAIQAAHAMGGRSTSIKSRLAQALATAGGGGGGGGAAASAAEADLEEGGASVPLTGAEGGATASAAATAATAGKEQEPGSESVARRERSQSAGSLASAGGVSASASASSAALQRRRTKSRIGSTLLLIMVAWRALALSILAALPLWLSDAGTRDATPVRIALLFALGAALAAALRGLHALMPQALTPFAGSLWTMAVLGVTLALPGPLTSAGTAHSAAYRTHAADALGAILVGLALLVHGGTVAWAVHLSKSTFKKEAHRARYDLAPAVALADVAGAVGGPLLYAAGDVYGRTLETSLWRYPFGETAWFSVCALLAGATLLFLGACGRPFLLRPPVAARGSKRGRF